MAVINVLSKEDLFKILKRLPGKAYMAVTDELTSVWLAPIVTSTHRHYFQLTFKDEEEWKEIRKELEKAGIMIVTGNLSFPRSG